MFANEGYCNPDLPRTDADVIERFMQQAARRGPTLGVHPKHPRRVPTDNWGSSIARAVTSCFRVLEGALLTDEENSIAWAGMPVRPAAPG